MSDSPVSSDRLVWMRRDIERRFGFRGSRFTRVGSVLPAILAAAMTVAFFGAMIAIGSNAWTDMFTQRGWTPYVIVFFTLWAIGILLLKRSKLKLQRKALQLEVVPEEIDFVLSLETAGRVVERLFAVSDDPKLFVLLNRIYIGLSNVQNLGRAVDLGEILRTQADHDESVMETSFNLTRGLVWAIPILGFIGTVSGLSEAIGGFGRVLSQTEDPSQLIDALKGVTGGLATAFETTLLALIAALLVQMLVTFQKKREEEFLDECTDYCQRDVLSRLRLAASPSPPSQASSDTRAMPTPQIEPKELPGPAPSAQPPVPPPNRTPADRSEPKEPPKPSRTKPAPALVKPKPAKAAEVKKQKPVKKKPTPPVEEEEVFIGKPIEIAEAVEVAEEVDTVLPEELSADVEPVEEVEEAEEVDEVEIIDDESFDDFLEIPER